MKKAIWILFFFPLMAFGQKTIITQKFSKAERYAQSLKQDSAFLMLFSLAYDHSYRDYDELTTNANFLPFTHEKEWLKLISIVKRNELNYLKLDQNLILILDTVYKDDQELRKELPIVESNYGRNSIELKKHWEEIEKKDSINLLKVSKILDQRGWLGPDVIGSMGNSTLFMVIQHSPIETQIKYLPMMQDAAKKGNAKWSSLALLEDRIFLRTGKKQIYGSQVSRDKNSNEYYVLPLINPGSVDERRQNVGLIPIQDYINHWNIKWDSIKHIERSNLSDAKKLTGVWKYRSTTNLFDSTINENKKELLVFFAKEVGDFQKITNNKTQKGKWKVDRNKIFLTINENIEVFEIHILIKNTLVLIPTDSKNRKYKLEYYKQK